MGEYTARTVRPRTQALVLPVLRSSLGALGVLALLALLAGAVRIVPWLLDPSLPLAVTWVFARSVLAYLGEAALWLALPLGVTWALYVRLERGELQIPALLGVPESRTLRTLWPVCAAWASVLFAVSYASGVTAREPGAVLQHLLEEGEASCANVDTPSSQAVPLLDAAWVCQPGVAPRLVGRSPLGGVAYVARSAAVNAEVSQIHLQDASFLREGFTLHAQRVHLGGMRPFVASAAVPALLRALTAVLCTLASVLGLAWLLLRRTRPCAAPLALTAGLSGPLVGMLALAAASTHPVLGVGGALMAACVLPFVTLESAPRLWQRWRSR